MKAIAYKKYGDYNNLKLEQLDKPTLNDNEVLIKVCASSINSMDLRFLKADPFFIRFMQGIFRPKNIVLGNDISGVVEKVGSKVTEFKPGDEVYGDTSGVGGGFAEYVCIKEDGCIAKKPQNMTFEQSAAAPIAGITALQGLRDFGKIKSGQRVIINGASGGVGTFAVMVSKAFGAYVTGVCSTKSVETVKGIGADNVIDYKKENFLNRNERYDLIFDVAANLSAKGIKKVLVPGGTCVLVGFTTIFNMMRLTAHAKFSSNKDDKKIISMGSAKASKSDLNILRKMMEDGDLVPAIDRTYSLDETPQAMKYFDMEHTKSKVIITVNR